MEIVDRLMLYRDHTGLSNSQFADQAGIPRPTLSQFLNGRNKRLSDELVAKLHTAYPDLNVIWLLFGEGDMLTARNIEISEGLFDEKNIESLSHSAVAENVAEQQSTQNSSTESASIYKSEGDAMAEMPKTATFEQNVNYPPVVPADPRKSIRSIMVFYSDNSYETFIPASSHSAGK